MEPRVAMAVALLVVLFVASVISLGIYFHKRQQRRHRMMGRGKTMRNES